MIHDRAQFEQLLDGSLAGELSADERSQFDAMLNAQPELRAQAELQQRIDAGLRSLAMPPDHIDVLRRRDGDDAVVPPSQSGDERRRVVPSPASLWLRRFAVAAMVMLGAFGVWRTWEVIRPQPAPYPDSGPRRSPEAAYHEIIAAGYEPAWVCKDDQEFVDNVRNKLGEPFIVAPRDPAVRVLGLAYANTISRWTVLILTYVDGQPVVVFADRKLSDRGMPTPESPELKWHRREFGSLVLYELSPFAEPRVLPLIEEPRGVAVGPGV